MFAFIILRFMSVQVKSSCDPCDCLPNDRAPRYMICQGWIVDQYPPFLSVSEKATLEEIYVVETYMYCLPAFNASEYIALKVFEESKNILFHCPCLETWRVVENFYSDCEFEEFTTTTEYGVYTTEGSEDNLTTTSNGENTCCPSGSGRATTGPPSPPPPTGGRGPWPTTTTWSLVGVLITLALCLIATLLVKKFRCQQRRSRCCCCCRARSRRGVTTSDLPMHVINPIYTGPDLEWDD